MEKILPTLLASVLCSLVVPTHTARAQTTAFTYQGRLLENGASANGSYDLKFTLHDSINPIEGINPVQRNGVAVNNGLFTVTLDFGAMAFTGADRWLEIAVKTNGSPNPYIALTPVQPFTSAPYSLRAAAAAGIIGSPGEPVEMKVNGQTALRLQFAPDSPSLIGGALVNDVEFGVSGATIGGGGAAIFNEQNVAWGNLVQESFGTIGGGFANLSGGFGATVAGGGSNRISSAYGFIGGGRVNEIGLNINYGTVAGGFGNSIIGIVEPMMTPTIAGGCLNRIGGIPPPMTPASAPDGATIAGGIRNIIELGGVLGAIGGGKGNSIVMGVGPSPMRAATIAGGESNSVAGIHGTIGGGVRNSLFSGVGPSPMRSATIAGGDLNTIDGASWASIGGGQGNSINPIEGINPIYADHSTIAGGGLNTIDGASYATIGGGRLNGVDGCGSESLATIAGGLENLIETEARYGTISGGAVNRIGPYAEYVTIAGGENNSVAASHGTIGGGRENSSGGPGGMIGGGVRNEIGQNIDYGTVAGGFGNSIIGVIDPCMTPTIAGGYRNRIGDLAGGFASAAASGSPDGATIAGGIGNGIDTSGAYSAIGGGLGNINGGVSSTIGGGESNVVVTGCFSGHVGGGFGNRIENDSDNATIGGGKNNSVAGFYSTIAGGENNRIRGEARDGTIGGGFNNSIDTNTWYATIAGGRNNVIMENVSDYSSIAGGVNNTIQGGTTSAAIGGGELNSVQSGASHAMIPGGRGNIAAGSRSFAAGTQARAGHLGAFVWADSASLEFASTAANEFSARATGGARFVSAINGSGVPTAGVTLASGSGMWAPLSDRNAKENFAAANGREILEKVAALPLASWNYKAQEKSIRHLGPMAQDFHAAFGLGETNTTIGTVDADGIALAAIQGLNQKHEAEVKSKDARIAELEQRLEKLERLMNRQDGGAK